MAGVRYTAFGKKRAGGRLVWGVLRMDGRKQSFRTVGEGDATQLKAEKHAAKSKLRKQRLLVFPGLFRHCLCHDGRHRP